MEKEMLVARLEKKEKDAGEVDRLTVAAAVHGGVQGGGYDGAR